MKKYLLVALTAIFAINMMAQEEPIMYPYGIEQGWDYTIDGVKRSYFTSNMLQQIVAQESQANANLEVVAQRWFSNGPDYGYDTIAQYKYENYKPILVEDAKLDTGFYKDVLWSINWQLKALSETDTVMYINFDYYNSKYLEYYVKSDTAYTAYAGLPYLLNSVSNPLQLPLSFSSSDLKVASVDNKGLITVAGKGKCTIKALFAGDEEIHADSAEWELVVNEGDYYKMYMLSKEMRDSTWTVGKWTYHSKGFDRIEITEANCNDIYGDGKVSFDIKTRTLTLNNYQRTYTEEEDGSMGWSDWLDYWSGPLPLNIKVIGECEIRHNSAGLFGGWDMNIIGESGSKLTLQGRFPQLSAEHQLTISGCEVHAFASTPHPLMHCEILRVDDNSFFEAKFDIEYEMSPEEAIMAGAHAISGIEELILGNNMVLRPEGAKVGKWDGEPTIIDAAGNPVLAFEISMKGTAIENVFTDNNDARKVLFNGQVLILREGKAYTVTGLEVK